MPRALFFGVFVLLSAAVFAVPTADQGQISIGDIVNLLGLGFVSSININITTYNRVDLAAHLGEYLLSVNVTISNPLPIELTIKSISSSAGLNGTELATFSHTFSSPGLVVGPLGSRNSGIIPNVLVTEGVENSLDIVPFGVLDLSNINANIQALTIGGNLGFPLELDGLRQDNVPTNYNLDLTSS